MIPKNSEERFKYRNKTIFDLQENILVGYDFSHASINVDLADKEFKNCIFYNTDFRSATIRDTTKFDFSGQRNPFTSMKLSGQFIAKTTTEQMEYLSDEQVNGVTSHQNRNNSLGRA